MYATAKYSDHRMEPALVNDVNRKKNPERKISNSKTRRDETDAYEQLRCFHLLLY